MKEYTKLKLHGIIKIGLMTSISFLLINYLLVPNILNCDITDKQYKDSPFEKANMTKTDAIKLCKNTKTQINYGSLILFTPFGFILFMSLIMFPKWDKEEDKILEMQNYKCKRCYSTIPKDSLDFWIDRENKACYCERCGKILGFDKKDDEI